MPLTHFICPDGQEISIEKCLSHKGCRMNQRCATLPYLRTVSFDREFQGVSPSSAGNGPRLIYLKATTDYATDPCEDQAWAAFGTLTHKKLAAEGATFNVLSEEPLSDEQMKGIPDILEEDENNEGSYVLTDYKTFGSYKVSRCLGYYQEDEPVLEAGEPVKYKSGKKKGEIKTHKVTKQDQTRIDLKAESLQLNRYRIFWENSFSICSKCGYKKRHTEELCPECGTPMKHSHGFPISRMQLQVLVRDGGLWIASSRGVEKKIYLIPIPKLPDSEVLEYYSQLQKEVDEAFRTGWARKCSNFENWDGRRCKGCCEVSEPCRKMDEQKKR
jgi:hypothetical protein